MLLAFLALGKRLLLSDNESVWLKQRVGTEQVDGVQPSPTPALLAQHAAAPASRTKPLRGPAGACSGLALFGEHHIGILLVSVRGWNEIVAYRMTLVAGFGWPNPFMRQVLCRRSRLRIKVRHLMEVPMVVHKPQRTWAPSGQMMVHCGVQKRMAEVGRSGRRAT